MSALSFKKWGVVFILLALGLPVVQAQEIDEPILVPVKYTVTANLGYDYYGDDGTIQHQPSTMDASLNGTSVEVYDGGLKTTPVQTPYLEVGKTYQFEVSIDTFYGKGTVTVSPQPGYLLTVDGVAKTSFTIGDINTFNSCDNIYSVRIIPAADLSAKPAGSASSLSTGQLKWNVALGSLLNGGSAMSISMVGAGTSDWSAFYTPATLYYEAPSPEAYVYRVNGNLRQILAKEAFVDVVTLTTTSYELRFYTPSQAQGSTYPKTITGKPFVTYRVQQDTTATKLRITKETRTLTGTADTDTTAPIVRSETTTVERTGTSPAFTWTMADWTVTGQSVLTQQASQWASNASGGHDETITLAGPDPVTSVQTTVAQTTKSHTHFAWGDTPTNVTSGTTNSTASNFVYNTNTSSPASYGFIQSMQVTGGNWEAYSYFSTTNPLQLGTLSQVFKPFLNAPGTISTTASSGLVTSYTYVADAFGMLTRPTTIQTQINGVTIANRTITYSTTTVNGMSLVTATRTDKTSSTATLASSSGYYQEDTADAFFRGQTHFMTSANGVKQSYVRQRGTLVGATFTPATTGTASFIGVITGASTTSTGATALSAYAGYTISTVYLIPNKSMLSTTYRDNYARIARTESSVWDGAAWQLVTWVNFTYNWNNQLISRVSSNGDDYEAGYAGDLKIWDQDVTGITIYYDYDVGGRLWHVTKAGLNGAPNLVTTYAYNAASQVVSQSTNAVGGSEQLVSSHTYDLAGRMSSETPTGLGATTYAYDPVNRTTTATLPNGATQIQSLYLDGQPASKTGTGVVPEYYTYSIQSDGQKVTQVNLATSTSTRLVKTWTDWIDRTTRTERPGFAVTSQPVFYEQNTYSATTGLLTRTDRTVGSASLYQYDPLGNLILSGLDVTNNGTLDLTSTDRITGQDKWFANENGAWWLATTSTTYASATSSTPTTLQSTRQRLTGFTGNLRSESRMIDAEGNTTVQTVSVNSTTATVTQTTTLPGLANPKVDTAVNGLPVSSLSPDGLTSTISYDGLQRPQTTVDPRTGSSTVAYVSCTALPFTVTDSRNVVVATYNYDNLGRKNWVKNASGYYTRYAYDALGHVLNQWGDATSPCSYGYNAYGERVTLGTYQAENGWNAATWPGGTPTSTTTWNYDVPSGLLISKTDAANKSVTYTYNSRGQVAQRLWVRLTTGGQPITATYTYDTNTGDPLQTAYNDGTPTVSLTYNRLGQTTAATDWAGTRSFVYDSTSPWRLNTETLPTFYQSQIITRLYEATTNSAGTIKGATDGFQLGTAASPAASLQQTYAHNNGGRLANLTSAYGAGAVSQTFNYTYVTNSRLVQSLAAQGTAFTQTRSYEAQRDLLTSIVGQWSTATTSSYGYTYNDLGQRQTSTQGGTAFTADYGDVVTQNYTYDARGELSSAVASLGTNPTNQLPGRYFEYAYDAAGNRTLANHTGNSSLAEHFTSNALNQIASRENNSRAIQGVAATDAYAQVNSVASARQGSFWESELLLGNTGGTAVSTANVSIGASVSTGAPASAQTLYLLTGGASETLTHDLDGNLSADGIWTYSWDAENRLSTMMMNAGAVLPNGPPQQLLQFQYDYQGRRVSKKVSFWQGGTWVLQSERRFIYDGWNLIAETQANGTLIRSYTWGLDLTGSFTAAGGVGGLLQVTDHASGVRYFPTYDGNGNVTTLVNAATGSVAAIYEYNSFGELLRSQGSYASSNPIRFSSKFADDETGLIYYGHRYYDPHNGRFINRDPIEEAGGMNLYGFCGNDGVNHWDYLGNSWLSKIWHKITKWVGAHEWAAIAIGAVVGVLTAGAALYGLAPYVGVSMTYGQAITLALTGSNAVATLTGLGTAMVGGIAGFAGGVASSALSGANLRQSLKAGLVGGAMGAASAYAAYEIKAGINDIMQSKASFIEVTRDPLTKQYVASDFFDRGALSGSSNDYWMNGMLNDRGHAIELSLTQMNQNHYYIIYNESHGLLADMMESVAQKITGTSSISRDVADFMQTVNLSGSTFTVHSQAGLILNNAIEILHDRGVSMSGMHVAYNGAAVNEVASRGLLRTVGGVADYFQAHAGDAVPNLIGGNALYPFRPFDLALSIAEIPLLFVGGKSLSPHTVYVAPTP